MKSKEAQIIRERRIELGLTQQAVASELGMHIRQYQRYEYGELSLAACAMKTGLKVCAILELDPYELIFLEEKKPVW